MHCLGVKPPCCKQVPSTCATVSIDNLVFLIDRGHQSTYRLTEPGPCYKLFLYDMDRQLDTRRHLHIPKT